MKPFAFALRNDRISLQEALCGRDLTGLYLEEETNELHLRFLDAAVIIDLARGKFEFCDPEDLFPVRLTFPGWLRVAQVIEEESQFALEVAGALFTARIVICRKVEGWSISLQGGRILASH